MAKRTPRHRPTGQHLAPTPQRHATSLASHQAAGNDLALADWNPLAASPDADLLSDLSSLVPRSRDLARNNGLMAGAMQTYRDCIVGHILRLSAQPDTRLLGWSRAQSREWADLTEAKFATWADTTDCDAANEQNLLGLTLNALGGAMLNGDAAAIPIWQPRPGSTWSTRIMLVESDRLDTPPQLQHNTNIRRGIERNQFGAPQAYWFASAHPGDAYLGAGAQTPITWERIPATTPWGRRRVIHLHDKERTGQSRGKPIVAAVMRDFFMAGNYASNELQASVANSLVAAFLESDLDPAAAAELFGDDPRQAWGTAMKDADKSGLLRRKLQGGAVIPLPAGARLSSFSPSRPNAAFEAFMLATLRNISAGLNIPYELLLKDFSKTNYSSARASLLEAWRYFQGRRRWLTDYWLRAIYELWLEEAANAGHIKAPDLYANRYAYIRCRFIFGGRGWVDPVREANAAQIRTAAGLSTMEIECAEQGLDYQEVMDQQALEQQMRAERGLPPLGATPNNPAQQGQTQANNPTQDNAQDNTQDQPEDATA